MRRMIIFVACCGLAIAPILADDKAAPAQQDSKNENADSHRLPDPLHDITCDFGPLEKHFKLTQCKHYPAGEFKVDKRVVTEETIVWVLEAKQSITGREVYQLLHPNVGGSP